MTGCWHQQTVLPEGILFQAFKELHQHAIQRGRSTKIPERCLYRSWSFHREAGRYTACNRDSDCEVVIGKDPLGPVWLGLLISWRTSQAAQEYELLEEECGDIDNLGEKPRASCRQGNCWLSNDPGDSIWSIK
jgi:hypothetical protein